MIIDNQTRIARAAQQPLLSTSRRRRSRSILPWLDSRAVEHTVGPWA